MEAQVQRQVVLDTETTGMSYQNGHRLIEIGAVEILHRKITDRHFHVYLNPKRKVDVEAFKVHGISDDFLKGKPEFYKVFDEFINFVKGATLIIHNATFDLGFINHEISLLKSNITCIEEICDRVIDTLGIARKLFPGKKNNLDALCKRFNIDNSIRTQHGALLDARLLAQVFLAMTGGQANLELTHKVSWNSQKATKIDGSKLRILPADAEEEVKHKEFLKYLKEKSLKCLWRE